MSKIKLFDLSRQYKNLRAVLERKVSRVLASGQYIMGQNVKTFEMNASKYLSVKNSVTCNSGTDALILALRCLDIGHGDEVITTPFTYFSTTEAILLVGAKPIFVDIDSTTFNIDCSQIERKITKKTKAILGVHIFGHPYEAEKVKKICKKYKIKMIEDCAQSFGASIGKKQTGTFGDIGCFSFFPTKNLGCAGDGGMLVTNNNRLAKKARMLRNHGGIQRNEHNLIGYNSRLDEIQAVVLIEKLKLVDKLNNSRIRIAKEYSKTIDNKKIITPIYLDKVRHIYHQFTLIVDNRARFTRYLTKNDIPFGIYYPKPAYLQPAVKKIIRNSPRLKVTESVCKRCVSIPIYPELSKKECDLIINTINDY